PGRDGHVTTDVIEKHRQAIVESDVVVTQLEIPMDTVDYVAQVCEENNIDLVVNPAPAQKLTDNIINYSTYITPNQIELTQLAAAYPACLTEHVDNIVCSR